MHQSFVTTAIPPPPPHTHLQGRVDKSWAKVHSTYFLGVPNDIRILIPGRFSIAKGRAKSKVLNSKLTPGGGAYSRALKTEKS